MQELVQADAGQRESGVHEGEDRQDHERHGRVQIVLQLSQRRLALRVTHGNAKGDQDTGQRGMHPGLQHGDPQDNPDEKVGRHARHAQPVEQDPGRQRRSANQKRRNGQVTRVEDGDDHDRRQVVEDGQGEQKGLERRRDPPAKDAQQPQGEGDVRGDRDAPAIQRDGVLPVQGEVDRRRHQHAAQRAESGQGNGPHGRELAFQDLALDLQADDEKEQGHQAVVDPEQQRLVNDQVRDLYRNDGVQQRRIDARQRRIGGDHGRHRGPEQQDPAGRFQLDEIADGECGPAGRWVRFRGRVDAQSLSLRHSRL